MTPGITLIIVFVQVVNTVAMLLIGYALGRARRTVTSGAPKPNCMCGHHYGTHADGRSCEHVFRDVWNVKIGKCACTLYVGPDPVLSGLWHPPAKDKP